MFKEIALLVTIIFQLCAIVYALKVLSDLKKMENRGRKPSSTKPPNSEDDPQTVLVKRTKASFRNPAKTMTTSYDEYKSSKGLYAPVKPGKGSTADDIDLNDKERR